MSKQVRRIPATKRAATRSPRAFYLGLGAIAIAGIATLGYLSSRPRDVAAPQIDPSLPAVESNGYVMGSAAAPVEVVEFGDFECPQCGRFSSLTEPDVRTRLIEPGTVRLRFIDFPLSMHRNTWNASRAAACADEQGKFWEMHDAIFESQDRWNGEATRNPDGVLKDVAKQVGVNQQQFDQCIDTKKTQAKVQAHEAIAVARQIPATPTFIIGGRMATGAISYDEFKRLVDDALAKQKAAGGDSTVGRLKPVSDASRPTPATKAPAAR